MNPHANLSQAKQNLACQKTTTKHNRESSPCTYYILVTRLDPTEHFYCIVLWAQIADIGTNDLVLRQGGKREIKRLLPHCYCCKVIIPNISSPATARNRQEESKDFGRLRSSVNSSTQHRGFVLSMWSWRITMQSFNQWLEVFSFKKSPRNKI